MSTQVAEKRGRGRPEAFPGVDCRMAGYNLPVATLERVAKAVKARNAKKAEGAQSMTQNTLVNRALLAYLRRD